MKTALAVKAILENGEWVEVPLAWLTFPGGEHHVTVTHVPSVTLLQITAHLKTASQIMQLLLLKDALDRLYPGISIRLVLPYVPYARQDRVANPGEPLSAKVFCQLINQQGFCQVQIDDPHSDVLPALLDRVVINDPLHALLQVKKQLGDITLVAPDAGAAKRVMKLAKGLDCQMMQAEKVRDTVTGQITGTRIQGSLPATSLLVVDDICDGGRTFTELSRSIRASGSQAPLYLYVTHGIFSKGLDELLQHFDGIFARYNWIEDTRCQSV